MTNRADEFCTSPIAENKYRPVAPKQQDFEPTGYAIDHNSPRYTNHYATHTYPSLSPGVSRSPPFHQTPQPGLVVKFETALEFLDQVKTQYSAQPYVYKQFLKIMKDFKLHEIDTPGVIERVSELFKGQTHLILGFNHFLPEGYKIEISDLPIPNGPSGLQQNSLAPLTPSSPLRNNPPSVAVSTPAAPTPPVQISTPPVLPSVQNVSQVLHSPTLTTQASPKSPNVPVASVVAPVPLAQEMPVPISPPKPISPKQQPLSQTPIRKQPELDHARNYVKKIKVRFETQPEIYKSFLRILHTYHEEQHTIKDVYDQVATLFSSHPDLLREFKEFLPENPAENEPPVSTRQSKRTKAKRIKSLDSPPSKSVDLPPSGEFFYSMKSQLRADQHLYTDFLKLLGLFNDQILSKNDLLHLVDDLFTDYPEVAEEFKQFCNFSEEELQPPPAPVPAVEPPPPSPPMVPEIDARYEIDFSACKKCGPSYRELPESFVKPVCSGRTEMCNELLNDIWLSVPTGTEDGYFKASTKNEFEESLFTCEDDRFELDLIIELNHSTIQTLLDIIHKIQSLPPNELLNFKLEDGMDILHLRAIERVYGEKSQKVIRGINQNPVVAVPIVLKRLQQKDHEWRMTRSEWNNIWREVNEKNYAKSLDYQSATFKLQEKKNLSSRELLAELTNEKYRDASGKGYCMKFPMHNQAIFRDIEDLIIYQLQHTYNQTEAERYQSFLQSFVRQFFQDPSDEGFLFYGNTPFFFFFRYIQQLHMRLTEALSMADKSFADQANRSKNALLHRSHKQLRFESPQEIYRTFLEEVLHPLIVSELDPVKYEDQCAQFFGVHSYKLYTLDRLLQSIVKQIQSIFEEESSCKLLKLHSYEESRSTNGILESIYHTNALNLINGDNCFKFTFHKTETGAALSILLLDSQQPPGIVELHPKEKPTTELVPHVQTESEAFEIRKHHVFLLRNLNKVSRKNVRSPVIIRNGLECKVCTTTFRLFYVEETEDFFYRIGQLKKAATRAKSRK